MRCCFIACDNGLGHLRRVVSVCRELQRQGKVEVTLLANEEAARRLGFEAKDFRTQTSAEALRKGIEESCRWHERLPNLDSYDVIVSDNLPEVLELRKDAILMGSFLWHLVLDDVDQAYRDRASALLERVKPPMLGSAGFALEELRQATRFVDVGLFGGRTSEARDRLDLLISCGLSGECMQMTERAVATLPQRGPGVYRRVYVEPRLMPYDSPAWMYPADFSPAMFSELAAGVIRPGMGTVTDLLQNGARMYCFYEGGNREMMHNAVCIEQYGVGFNCKNVDSAVALALDGGGSDSVEPKRSVGELRFDGTARAARYIGLAGRA